MISLFANKKIFHFLSTSKYFFALYSARNKLFCLQQGVLGVIRLIGRGLGVEESGREIEGTDYSYNNVFSAFSSKKIKTLLLAISKLPLFI